MRSFRQPFRGDYRISLDFGEEFRPLYKPGEHKGIDYECPTGTEILAADDGYIIFAGNNQQTYGKYIVISHGNGYVSYYAHLSEFRVSSCDRVKKGQVIALSGNTGNSTGPHLHFEVRDNTGKPIDPKPLIQSVIDPNPAEPERLKGAEELPENVMITAPAGAWGWNKDHTKKVTVLEYGTKGTYTGSHYTERNGYEYCEVLIPLWVAVNDGDCQIIDKAD